MSRVVLPFRADGPGSSGGPGDADEPGWEAPAHPLRFQVGEWRVDPSCNRVTSGTTAAQLEPRVMELLVYLAGHAGKVVTRRALIDAVWRTEYITDHSLTHAVAELRGVLGDDARSPRYIETIPKRGYRMIAEPRGLSAEDPAPTRDAVRGIGRPTRWRWLATGFLVVAAVTAAALVWTSPRLRDHSGGSPPRLVVLPFENLGGAEGELFAVGLSDEITSRLAVVHGLAVVARTSALNFDRRGKTAREIGDELGVDYVLEGSVRWQRGAEGGERVRVTPQLIRVADDRNLWAATYERHLDEVFGVQAEIGREVVAQLDVAIGDSERRAIAEEPFADLAAYHLFLTGNGFTYSAEIADYRTAIEYYERAVELAPGFVIAFARLALAHARAVHFGFDPDGEHAAGARAALAQAEALDPLHPEVRHARGTVLYYLDGRLEESLTEFRAVLELVPNHSDAMAGAAYVLRRMGRWDESYELLERALSRDPLNASFMWNLGSTLAYLRRYDEAELMLRRAAGVAPGMRTPHVILASVYLCRDGTTERARAVVEGLPGPRDGRWLTAAYNNEVFDGRYQEALDLLRSHTSDRIVGIPRSVFECGCLVQLGRSSEAEAVCDAAVAGLQEMLSDRPGDSGLWMDLAGIHARRGRREQAMVCARRAVDEIGRRADAPQEVEVALGLASVLMITGEHGAAVEELERLLRAPSLVSRRLLAGDAHWRPLRGRPRFERLLAGG